MASHSVTKPEQDQRDAPITTSWLNASDQSRTAQPLIPDETLVRLLEEAAAALALIVQQYRYLPRDQRTSGLLEQMHQDLTRIQQVISDESEIDDL